VVYFFKLLGIFAESLTFVWNGLWVFVVYFSCKSNFCSQVYAIK